ncbi:hypothetical protein BJX61DRAFT_500911 [Aspergillus egyptiacus]|nr:hypothetical protein BJX61DRAFT_500911 [Aspergillus egyptiacus]
MPNVFLSRSSARSELKRSSSAGQPGLRGLARLRNRRLLTAVAAGKPSAAVTGSGTIVSSESYSSNGCFCAWATAAL